MAFQHLTEEAIAMLSDAQRAQYYEDLSTYEKRKALVEKLDALAQVDYPEVHPVVTPIKLPVPAEVPAIKSVESNISVPRAVVPQMELRLPTLDAEPVQLSELPSVAVPTVTVSHPEFEFTQPVVPNVAVPAVEAYTYQPPVLGQVSVPEPLHIQANVPTLGSFETPKPEVPAVILPTPPEFPATLDGVQLAAEAATSIPSIQIQPLASLPAFKQPEVPTLDPVFVTQPPAVDRIIMPKPDALNVPAVAVDVPPLPPTFELPEIPAAPCPAISAAPAPSPKIRLETPTLSELPRVQAPVLPKLPAFVPVEETTHIDAPAIKLPDPAKLEAISRPRQLPSRIETVVSAPEVKAIPVKNIEIAPPVVVPVPKLSIPVPQGIENQKAEILKQIRVGGLHEE